MTDGKQPQLIGFNQPDWDVRGNVYNVNGDLILHENSSSEDFSKALSDILHELAKLQNLPSEVQQKTAASLTGAMLTSSPSDAEKKNIIERLDTAKTALTSVKDSVEGAWELAKTIKKLAGWVSASLL